jgi:glycolate oxidase FAD binding subunit
MENGSVGPHPCRRVTSLVEQIRAANEERRRLRIVGAGTWLNAGRPTAPASTLSVREHAGIVEYVPGDLTLTARAGTTLGEIAAATKPHGQWLPIDPWGSNDGTIGATISTATTGPQSFAIGLPRDVVLGMEFVTGVGDVVRPGGRVVKNVAGFDLTRLMVGSWGTLGIISEVTLRLRARPDEVRTFAISVAMQPAALNELALKLRGLPFTPLASELVDATLASSLNAGAKSILLCRIGGNARSVAAQRESLVALGDTTDMTEDVWEKLRLADVTAKADGVWRWSRQPAVFGDTWHAAERGARDAGAAMLHGNPARGIVRVLARGESGRLARAAASFAGTSAIETLPIDAWPLVPDRPAVDPISRAIRAKFDPNSILNPGILGEPVPV